MATCLDPSMVLAYNNLSKLWQQLGNFDRVVENLKQLLDLEPTNVAACSHLAGVLLHQGKREEAIKYLQQAIALQPTFVTAYCQRHSLSESTDLLARAKASCSKFLTALQEEVTNTQILRYLWQTYAHWGDVLLEYGSTKQAAVYYRQALDVKPDEV